MTTIMQKNEKITEENKSEVAQSNPYMQELGHSTNLVPLIDIVILLLNNFKKNNITYSEAIEGLTKSKEIIKSSNKKE